MLLMVQITVELPGDMDPEKVSAIAEAETARGIELIQAGTLRKIWRVVGARSNFSIWETDTLEEFHASISSLPMHPFMTVNVTPIIEHPATQAYEAKVGPFPTI